MIASNELRLGNRVLVNGIVQVVSTITTITAFTMDAEAGNAQVANEYSLERLQPVPLTDEILQECGFIYHEYFKFWQLITTDVRSEMDLDRDYDVIDFMRRPIIKKVASLHRLQNTYYILQGRELVLERGLAPAA